MRWLIVSGDQVLASADSFLFEQATFESLTAGIHGVALKVGQIELDDQCCDCYCWFIESADSIARLASGFQFYSLRSFLLRQSDVAFQLLGASVQLGYWLKDHQFCGRCAQTLSMREDDRALYCSSCDHRHYPRLSPCVIMLVTQGNRCLLAVHKRAPAPIFTALAGFVEAGETLEQAVAREVLEEVGVKVSHCEYVGSQPWPFPGQLMIGFIVQAASDQPTIDLQDDEISEARWFNFDQLPELIPPAQTLSGQLIRHFVQRCQKA
ncbi:hypothetical protein R50072_17390 [Simiduia litorea]|uniref:NAD(+) diphosphatase n=1 Tax=Simiduia litorea TaxID=1435348 RepID=UPI0036F33323